MNKYGKRRTRSSAVEGDAKVVDKVMTGDLAALAADCRRETSSFEATLRAVGVIATPRPAAKPLAGSAFVLMSLGRVYAQNMARAVSGVTALLLSGAFTFVLLIYTHGWRRHHGSDNLWPRSQLDLSTIQAALGVAIMVVVVYRVAFALAGHRCERIAREIEARGKDPTITVMASVRRISRWAGPLWVAGTTTFLVVFSLLWLTMGKAPLDVMLLDDQHFGFTGTIYGDREPVFSVTYFPITHIFRDQLAVIAIAIPASLLAASAIAKQRRVRARTLAVTGAILIAAGLYLATRDVGPLLTTLQRIRLPSTSLRVAVAACGMFGVLFILSAVVVWRRRRDHGTCGIEESR
ncbi:MAG: hypothetical protein ABI867_11300 [Kofleriaceae bacterium]